MYLVTIVKQDQMLCSYEFLKTIRHSVITYYSIILLSYKTTSDGHISRTRKICETSRLLKSHDHNSYFKLNNINLYSIINTFYNHKFSCNCILKKTTTFHDNTIIARTKSFDTSATSHGNFAKFEKVLVQPPIKS